ncbi:uncharacterized protein LAJ45_00965 [Morchella importuna]|uniref:uncharacterized protein n=1 Tax=Morchella importuna TaxID=1174673 RepID=UPI001E8D84C8|nr:uncharacterized protein LAJ45_00965 [Morchella importuna]KAH8154438.1 hypothetical protein LAJ45_00965 [Morchella importuna]
MVLSAKRGSPQFNVLHSTPVLVDLNTPNYKEMMNPYQTSNRPLQTILSDPFPLQRQGPDSSAVYGCQNAASRVACEKGGGQPRTAAREHFLLPRFSPVPARDL